MKRPSPRLVATALLLTAVVLGAGTWFTAEVRERRRAEGTRVAAEAAELARHARALAGQGQYPQALPLLERAVSLLGSSRGAKVSAGYAALLVDLASLRSAGSDPGQRKTAASLLDDAWRIPSLPPQLRARIALDRGALCALEGDMRSAEAWYVQAEALSPSDEAVKSRLALLRRPLAKSSPNP